MEKQFNDYANGAVFWRDNAASYGVDEALKISRSYLELNLKREHSNDERQFCREIFYAIYEVIAAKTDPARIVYPYSFQMANDRLETSYYHTNRGFNEDCTRAIDSFVRDSCYKTNFYNLETVAMLAILDYGFNRVCAVLAFQIQEHRSDGRYSRTNKEWADTIILNNKSLYFLNSHAVLIDGMATHVRELFTSMNAERYALPGQEEHDRQNDDFRIVRSIMVDEHQGYAIGHNPDGGSQWVCWQFYNREDGPSYNWGDYGDEQIAIDSFNARVFVALNKV